MYIMAPLSARKTWFGSSAMVTIWDSFPSILEATSKLMGVAKTPSEDRVCGTSVILASIFFTGVKLDGDVVDFMQCVVVVME